MLQGQRDGASPRRTTQGERPRPHSSLYQQCQRISKRRARDARTTHLREARIATPTMRSPSIKTRLVDLLHLGALVAVLLEGRQLLDIVRLVIVLDRETELDHAVDAAREGRRLVEREARREQRRLEEEVHKVLDGLVTLIRGGLGLELLHNRVLRVDLHRLLG